MKITLKPEQEKFIQEQLEKGRFTNAEQVIDVAFQLLEQLNNDYLQWVEETRQKVEVAMAELEKGEGLDEKTVVREILERFKEARTQSQ